VGVERFACTIHSGFANQSRKNRNSRNMLCTVQITIRVRGTIQAQGVIHLGKAPDELGITGGTGDSLTSAGPSTERGLSPIQGSP
jgi:hypothetical protein